MYVLTKGIPDGVGNFVGLPSEPISLIVFIDRLFLNGLADILVCLTAALDSRECQGTVTAMTLGRSGTGLV